jgi:hypothetical protein
MSHPAKDPPCQNNINNDNKNNILKLKSPVILQHQILVCYNAIAGDSANAMPSYSIIFLLMSSVLQLNAGMTKYCRP